MGKPKNTNNSPESGKSKPDKGTKDKSKSDKGKSTKAEDQEVDLESSDPVVNKDQHNGAIPEQAITDKDTAKSLASIETTLHNLVKTVDSVAAKQEKLEKDITGFRALNDQVSTIARDSDENTSQLATQTRDISDLKEEVATLKALVQKQSIQISHLQDENEELKNRSMRNNVLFHGLFELKTNSTEDPEATVRRFLTNTKMPGETELVFERVHRLGQYDPKAKTPRPIVARLISSKDTDRILAHGKTLPKSTAEDPKPRITPQFTPKLRETRKDLGIKANDLKTQFGSKVVTKIGKDKLYVNNQLHKEPVITPTTAEMLNMMPDDQRELLQGPELVHGDIFTLQGHSFIGTVAKVTSLNDVRVAYKKLLSKPQFIGAAHNFCAYTLFNPETAQSQTGHQDDNEHGAGRFLSQVLQRRNEKNTVLFVTRRFLASSHLGAARFNTIEEAAISALDKLD